MDQSTFISNLEENTNLSINRSKTGNARHHKDMSLECVNIISSKDNEYDVFMHLKDNGWGVSVAFGIPQDSLNGNPAATIFESNVEIIKSKMQQQLPSGNGYRRILIGSSMSEDQNQEIATKHAKVWEFFMESSESNKVKSAEKLFKAFVNVIRNTGRNHIADMIEIESNL
jgi:hypothetical protein